MIMYVRMAFLILIQFLSWMMILRAVLSWFPINPDGQIIRFLRFVTEPIIAPIRNLLSRSEFFTGLPIDLSFIIAFIVLQLLATLL